MIGKREMITQTMIRDRCPVPHQNEMSGTIARIGIAWRVTMNGNTARSMVFAWLMIVAKRNPIAIEMDQSDHRDLGARPQPGEHFGEGRPVEESLREDFVWGLQKESPTFVEQAIGDAVPTGDNERSEHEGWEHAP
jgi:hypothetical protein